MAWTPVGRDGELWLERAGEPHPIDAMVLERAAAAIGSVRQSSRGRAARGRDDANVATLLDPASSAADRSAAARRLHLSPTTRVRAVASPSGLRIEPADPEVAVDGLAGDGRAGVGSDGTPDELPASAVAARLALRLTADGPNADPGPRVVHARDTGGLLVLASAIGSETGKHTDVVALEQLAGEHPWLLATLAAVAEQSSLRAAAAALHVHHSTLQERIAHAERMLGWSIGNPAGRLRLQLALVLRRLHRTATDPAGDPAADGY
jgi:hypothetical protein